MATLTYSTQAPRRRTYAIEVDGRTIDAEEELLSWVRENGRGSVFYTRTNYGEKGKTYRAISRKKHFDDGYWVYTFWFTRKADAAIFKLMWDHR